MNFANIYVISNLQQKYDTVGLKLYSVILFLGCRIAASMASGDAFPSGEIGSGIGQKIPMQRSTANQFNNLSPSFASTWTDIVNPDGCESALHFVCMGAGALSSKLFPYQKHQQQGGIPVGCIPSTCVDLNRMTDRQL